MKLKLEKKKVDINGKYEKKDIHNILNSLLVRSLFIKQGDIFD